MRQCKRREFIRKLKRLDFDGPFSGSKHQFMIWKKHRLAIPTNDEYSTPQLKMMLKEIQIIIGREIKNEEWDDL